MRRRKALRVSASLCQVGSQGLRNSRESARSSAHCRQSRICGGLR